MLRKILVAAVFVLGAAQPLLADNAVDPQADFKAFREYFTKRFPKVQLNDFVNGPYSMDEGLRKQWKSIEEFPPYEFAVEHGKEMFAKPLKSGKTLGDCFPDKGIGIRQNYPYFDTKSGEVITLELALNQCLEANGEKPLDYSSQDMAALTAYMAFTSRGKPFDIKIPNDPRALAAYRSGEQYFYTRRGQLNFSCASCHVQNPGGHIRTDGGLYSWSSREFHPDLHRIDRRIPSLQLVACIVQMVTRRRLRPDRAWAWWPCWPWRASH